MKAIISTTDDPQYSFFIPITIWCWNKIGVDVIWFGPKIKTLTELQLCIANTLSVVRKKRGILLGYDTGTRLSYECPENKNATYAQVSRLFGGALGLDDDEIIITSDVDMIVLRNVFNDAGNYMNILGSDLTPPNQYPICYAFGRKDVWAKMMKVNGRGYQKCLDDMLGDIDCENMRGNYWGKDQEELYNHAAFGSVPLTQIHRARPGTQFASNRIDRDDSFWEDRLNHKIIDAHLWRPGYTDENFSKIIKLIRVFHPEEDLTWLSDYRNEYVKLLNGYVPN